MRLGSNSALTPQRQGRDGLRDGATIILAYVPFSLALGAGLASAGVPPLIALMSSVLIFAGAAQLVAVQLLTDGGGVAVVVLSGLVVNSRHLLYGASLAPHVGTWPLRTRAFAAYFLADPVYALAIARFDGRAEDGPGRLRYFLTMALTCWVGWVLLTTAGGLLAATLPSSLPLGLAAPLTFLVLLIPTVKDRPSWAAAMTAGAVAVPATQLPMGLGLLAAAIAGMLAGAVTERRRHA